ncbi:hypothetical protein CON22_18050 [Bacillus cereus]|nr:hypothetical protein CON22_18050 [Bacillus cereus]
MYTYKFVKIEINIWKLQAKEDYKTIIEEHAKNGWRFVQIFAPEIKNLRSDYLEIIFEKEVK